MAGLRCLPLLLACFSLLLMNCSSEYGRTIVPSIYHWKTKFDPTEEEKAFLDSLGVQKLYTRFFDVDWSSEKKNAVPLASLKWKNLPDGDYEWVPTVYITNRTLIQLPADQIPQLAQRIAQRIQQIADTLKFQEIQLDCDWSDKSRDNYFQLIERMYDQFEENPIQISATIRLHQVKFAERTGIPPVDRGMLMFYNMGDVTETTTQNSILDLETAENYLINFENYPLALDVALPLFSWGVVFRNDKAIQLLNNLRTQQLSDDERFTFLSDNRVKVRKSTYLNGFYLYKNDVIRVEEVPIEEIEAAAELIAPLLKQDSLCVSFYHLDTPTIQRYKHEQLENIYRLFD